MAETVGSHGVAAFTNPSNGDALDATVVKGNDNTLRSAYVDHDSDGGVHLQSSSLASRPAAGTQGRKWLTTDTGSVRLWYDNGSTWEEIGYVRSGALTTLTQLLVTTGGIVVQAGGVDAVGDSIIDGDLDVTGTITGGTIVVPAAGVQAGTFAAGNFVFPDSVSGDTVLATNGQMRGARATQSGAGGTVSFASANHIRHTMTGNGTLTLSGGVAGGVYTVEVLQDGTGGRTVAWSGAVWPNGATPVSTTTANRKDVFTFFYDGSNYLGVQFGANFASTA